MSQFYKTKLCPWYRVGRCRMGAHCNWSHAVQDVRPAVDLARTKLCAKVAMGGACRQPLCRYAHSYSELRATSDVYKTILCVYHDKGYCVAGESCRYAHGEQELRERPPPSVNLPAPIPILPSSSRKASCFSPPVKEGLYATSSTGWMIGRENNIGIHHYSSAAHPSSVPIASPPLPPASVTCPFRALPPPPSSACASLTPRSDLASLLGDAVTGAFPVGREDTTYALPSIGTDGMQYMGGLQAGEDVIATSTAGFKEEQVEEDEPKKKAEPADESLEKSQQQQVNQIELWKLLEECILGMLEELQPKEQSG